ncbi:MAG: autotransporter outer membrane beta-barrel domain-containing protein, partial [Phycisphaeraceae bacterium]|nr:autotransporter outer membrane beta-barrel domain-containing protein [Phycisphaeraceae bacterium]
WDINADNGGGFDPLTQLWARSAADYATPLEGTPEYLRGVELNSLRAAANLDPTSDSGILLGALDTIDTLEAYEAAIDGVGPTTQVSTIQLAANTQYFTVLRKEIQRRYDIVEQRTPAPFRLSNGTEYTSSDDQAVQSSIRRMTPESTTAEGFGVFWGRNLKTPTEGEDIKGISGNEYGGMGGFAWRFGDGFLGGINMGYSQITGDLNGGFGNTRVSTVRGGGFLAWSNGEGLFLDAALAGGWNNFKFTRVIPGTQISADSDASGFQMDLTVGGGYRFELSEGWALTPEASFMYSYVNTGDINEDTSSAAALNISPGDLSSVIGRVGGGLSWSALPGLVLDGELGWQGNFNFNGNYGVSLANQGTSLSFGIDDQAVNTAYFGGGIVWTPTYNVNVSLQYEGRSGEGFSSNMIFGGVSIGF